MTYEQTERAVIDAAIAWHVTFRHRDKDAEVATLREACEVVDRLQEAVAALLDASQEK